MALINFAWTSKALTLIKHKKFTVELLADALKHIPVEVKVLRKPLFWLECERGPSSQNLYALHLLKGMQALLELGGVQQLPAPSVHAALLEYFEREQQYIETLYSDPDKTNVVVPEKLGWFLV